MLAAISALKLDFDLQSDPERDPELTAGGKRTTSPLRRETPKQMLNKINNALKRLP